MSCKSVSFRLFIVYINTFEYRYDSEYDDLRLASASAGGPIMSDVESDLPPELDIDLNNILDNAVAEQNDDQDQIDDEQEDKPISTLVEDDDNNDEPDHSKVDKS